uniref:Thioredoxin domain-containing protein n=1 Tax=Anabas testudineus TaxID=64144 RepID=A0A7N6AQA9_ANATE
VGKKGWCDRVLYLMARRPDLLCGAIVLGVLLILAVKFTCSRARNVVAAARPPVRFFSPEAPIVDLYLGQLDQVERLRSMAEVSLIFFYAPWCAHSLAARHEVQQVAKKLAKQVQFVAVNCWWSQGKCRKQNRFYQYPTIHLFYRRFGPIDYKGPFVAPYVESFILRVITPLTYLPSRAMLQEFLSYHEPRVVGFFQFNSSPQPPGYLTYLSSALQALKRDFRNVVRFGVVTSKQVAEAISLKEDASVYLHRRFNSSLIFPRGERNFTSEAICSWVFEHHETVLKWLQPPGTKSRLLEHELNKGPALLLFLPHNPLASKPSPILQQVADIAVRYHSCDKNNNSGLDKSFTSDLLCCHSVLLPESSTSVCDVCLHLSPSFTSSSVPCTLPSTAQGGDMLQSYLRHCCLHQLPAPVSIKTATTVGCSNFLNSYSPFNQYSACCRKIEPQLNESQAKEGSDMQRVHLTPPPSPIPPYTVPVQGGDGITGLQCHTNRTLRFYVLDVALNWPLAVRLGAGIQRDGLFAAIVNLKDEVHYVLHRSAAATLTESLGKTSVFLSFFSLNVRYDTITVARVNVARNDLPWEFMVDHVPSVLLFPRNRKHLSVKFPDDLPITLPNLLHFILQHSGSAHYAKKPATSSVESQGSGPSAVLRAEFLALQREVQALHLAREHLSKQLAQLWRDNRRLTFDARSLEAQNAELQRERQSLEEQHQEKSRQLGEAVKRLQELADTSENLLNENILLRVLLRALKDKREVGDAVRVVGESTLTNTLVWKLSANCQVQF